MVLQALKKQWRELASAPVGHRFQTHYRRKHQRGRSSHRIGKLFLGITLVVAGVLLLFIPGPGSVLIVIGAALLGEESLVIARWLDALEIRLRKISSSALRKWRRASLLARSSLVLVTAVLAGGVLWIVYSRFLAS